MVNYYRVNNTRQCSHSNHVDKKQNYRIFSTDGHTGTNTNDNTSNNTTSNTSTTHAPHNTSRSSDLEHKVDLNYGRSRNFVSECESFVHVGAKTFFYKTRNQMELFVGLFSDSSGAHSVARWQHWSGK